MKKDSRLGLGKATEKPVGLARGDLACFATLMHRRCEIVALHRLLIEKLESVERGDVDRLMIFTRVAPSGRYANITQMESRSSADRGQSLGAIAGPGITQQFAPARLPRSRRFRQNLAGTCGHTADRSWQGLSARKTKNGRGREFPLIGRLREIMGNQRARADAVEQATGQRVERVFFHRDGSRIKDFRTAWRLATNRAGLKGLIPHDFRRCAARTLLRVGVPQRVAMRLLGHETPEIFRRYAITDAGMLQDAGRKLEAYEAKQDPNRMADRTIKATIKADDNRAA